MVLTGVLAAVLYLHELSRNAMSNTFYAAAVKSGTESWKALFFGSLDRSSFITVDKPPASLWVMEVSGRLFGFSSLSMLVPIALAGALTVVVVFHLVRRWSGDVAAVLAASALAVTPVVTAIFRSNEPDGVMTLFLVLAAWALWSALESGATSRLVLCAALLGMAFLTKMLEAFVVVPAFVLVYLFLGPPKLGRRLVQLLWGGLALVIASGWWVAIVELWPAGSRPYIDSSGDNSELSLIFGYNGFSRLLGTSSPFRLPQNRAGHRLSTAIANVSHFGSQPGWQRMFGPALGSQISWLIPVAALGLVAGLWATRRAPRPDLTRAGFVFWGVWAISAIVVLSSVQGTFHTYYVVEIAPALAGPRWPVAGRWPCGTSAGRRSAMHGRCPWV
jgi:4-amino-4-deoxy-L-arabinose transferase-like glycosyltransferase